jgi:3',5'-cyclic AMP phosphodiesterase CpdA
MADSTTFLHITDPHFSGDGTPFSRDDHKVVIDGIPSHTRETVFDHSFGRLADRLEAEGKRLDGLIFSGDAQVGGTEGGHRVLFNMVLKHFARVGISPLNIVAVPGNHDVDRNFPPSTAGRYRQFAEVWRNEGCVVPWLDSDDEPGGTRHCLTDEDSNWAVFAINSSNWCHAAAVLPPPLGEVWSRLPELAAPGDPKVAAKIRDQLDRLARFDMARLSDKQLERFKQEVDRSPKPSRGPQLRIAVLHHHLQAPSMSEEIKPFANISNLEQVRAALRDRGIDIVIHGHKHEAFVLQERFQAADGTPGRPLMTISGATIEQGREEDAMRLITLSGLPYNAQVRIEAIGLTRPGVDLAQGRVVERCLPPEVPIAGIPAVIHGSDIDEVYARATAAAEGPAANGILIVHLDLPEERTRLPLPGDYPFGGSVHGEDRERWLNELVDWWQRDRSGLEHRMPFVHGGRLRRYGGKFDQIERIKSILADKASTRALAVLVDPLRDFTKDGKDEQFASFSLVEFKRRELGTNHYAIDAVAFYRAQEFARWWPINVAELRHLQFDVCHDLGSRFMPGRITTIAADARTQSRTPTQVAMPIVDRWLDQAPQKLHALANAIAEAGPRTDEERAALIGWEQCLRELEAVTQDFNPDGVPVPVEGLEVLAIFLDAADREDLDPMVTALRGLASDNRSNEKSLRDRKVFDPCATRAMNAIAHLRRLTEARVRPSLAGS